MVVTRLVTGPGIRLAMPSNRGYQTGYRAIWSAPATYQNLTFFQRENLSKPVIGRS